MFPTTDGWYLKVGCWDGDVDGLEKLIAGDDWPEAQGEEREMRRPGLEALVSMCRAHIARIEKAHPEWLRVEEPAAASTDGQVSVDREDLDRVLGYRECPFRKSKDAQRPTEIREGK